MQLRKAGEELTWNFCCKQDEHILARKFADRWMLKTLSVGLFGREVFRREKTDPRQRFYDVVMAARMAGLNKSKHAPRVHPCLTTACSG